MISKTKVQQTIERAQRKLKAKTGLREKNPRPHFLGVGTQKGGTTTLYRLLKSHPEIYLPENKEIHFFTKYYERGESWYRKQFCDSPAGSLRGEITPYYLFHKAVPERIYRCRSDMKIIALVRNPVDRTLSQYFHSCRWKLETLTLEKALAAEKERLKDADKEIQKSGGTHLSHQEHSYIARSRYEEQLERYFHLFKSKNILVLKSEDLFSKEEKTLQSIQTFLNIAPFPQNTLIPHANEGKGEISSVSLETRKMLEKELQPTFKWLKEKLNINWDN